MLEAVTLAIAVAEGLALLGILTVCVTRRPVAKRRGEHKKRPWAGEINLVEEKLDAALRDGLSKACSSGHAMVRFDGDCPACALATYREREAEVAEICAKGLKRGTSRRKLRKALHRIMRGE